MSEQIPTVMTAYIDSGKAKIQAAHEKQQQRMEAIQRDNAQQAAIAKTEIQAVLELNFPAAVLPYVTFGEIDLIHGNEQSLSIQIPGLTQITFDVHTDWDRAANHYAYNKLSKRRRNYDSETGGYFEITRLTIAADTDDDITNGYRVGEDTSLFVDDIDMALAMAAEQEARRAGLEAKAARKTAELKQKREAREQASAKQEQANHNEREALFSLIEEDPVALALLKIFVAVKRERAGYLESIDSLNDSFESQGQHYDALLTNQKREADQAVRRARDEAETARYAADDLEAQLRRVKK